MIQLSNKHKLGYMTASGALAFDGQGWLWEWPLIGLGLMKPENFTVVLKTLTRHPRKGNLRWWKPWECVRLIEGGSVNKVGLTNPGIEYWCKEIAPYIDFGYFPIVVSILGNTPELVEMTRMLDRFDIRAIEVNDSCPNSGDPLKAAESAILSTKAVKRNSRHPIIYKVSAAQEYLVIARGLEGIAEAISINSVPLEMVFPKGDVNPLWKLEKRVGGGKGGVSGKPAQKHNWQAVEELAKQGALPIIAPSIMEFEDMAYVRSLGAKAVSFGAIHFPTYPIWRQPWTIFTNPCKPTQFVEKERRQHAKRNQSSTVF